MAYLIYISAISDEITKNEIFFEYFLDIYNIHACICPDVFIHKQESPETDFCFQYLFSSGLVFLDLLHSLIDYTPAHAGLIVLGQSTWR